jgi:hypothetical protein
VNRVFKFVLCVSGAGCIFINSFPDFCVLCHHVARVVKQFAKVMLNNIFTRMYSLKAYHFSEQCIYEEYQFMDLPFLGKRVVSCSKAVYITMRSAQ